MCEDKGELEVESSCELEEVGMSANSMDCR